MLENIQEQLKEQKRLLRLLVARVTAADMATPNELPDGLIFPITSVENLEDLENHLSSPETVSAVVSCSLSVINE